MRFVLGMALALCCSSAFATKGPHESWTYSSDKNAMGDHVILACTRSHEIMHQDAPYHSTHALLCASYYVQAGSSEPTVVVAITLDGKGLIRQEEFRYKFDADRPYLHGVEDDNTSQSLVPDWPKTFLKHVENSKTLIVEIPIYAGGTQDATFDLSGLKFPNFGKTEYEESQEHDASH